MLVPPPAVILSPPTPPMTVFVPLVNVMSSAAPEVKSELVTLSSTPALLKVTVPLSPTTVARAPAAVPFTVIVSEPAPPITTFLPEPIETTSASPIPALIDSMTVVSLKKFKRPSSPKTKLTPPPAVMKSPPTPPITVFTPSVNVMVSAAPNS